MERCIKRGAFGPGSVLANTTFYPLQTYYSFERDFLNQSNATFTSKTLFSFLRDLSPLAYSCLLTKLKIKYSIRHVFISSRLGSYFLNKLK